MSLVTDISPEELAALQEEMQNPANVERLHKKFTEAAQPVCLVNLSQRRTPTTLEIEVRADGEKPTRTEWFEVTHWSPEFFNSPGEFEVVTAEGEMVGPIYNRDTTRFDRAKTVQPAPGERPIKMGDANMILRLADGSLVHQMKGCLGTSTRRLP